MNSEQMLALAERVEAIGIENAEELARRGGGTMWAQMAADCLTTASHLRAQAHIMKENEGG